MQIPDINALVYAHRADFPQHERYRAWVEGLLNGPSSYGVVDVVVIGFVRLVTNKAIFREPTPLNVALDFAGNLRTRPQAIHVTPGPRHWALFDEFCRTMRARSGGVTDAYLAAVAVEHGHELVTEDNGFSRFEGLRTTKIR